MAISPLHPLLLVGAGPVGLTLALELARRRIPVRIIEQEEQRPALSKAIGINPRTLELLEESGVTERILAEGIRLKSIRLHQRGQVRVGNFSGVDHPYNFMTALPQNETERLLEEALAAEGVQVERGTTLTGFREEKDGVWVQLQGCTDDEVMTPLLCGTDGAKSFVRRAAGIGFSGYDDPEPWSLADFETDTALPAAINMLLDEEGPMLVIPFTKGVYRVASLLPDALERLPAEIPVRKVVFESQFKVSYRLADTFVRGRVVLAGDAAHVHAPVGARGMNLGIEDACTLAEVIRGRGSLEAWGKSRRRKARSVVRQTRVLAAVLDANNVFTRFARSMVFRYFERVAPLVMRRMLDV
jgi:2-polyprenyl-6-methoxyphenol hydroxylase-like FAD-dependent oxidoreductase